MRVCTYVCERFLIYVKGRFAEITSGAAKTKPAPMWDASVAGSSLSNGATTLAAATRIFLIGPGLPWGSEVMKRGLEPQNELRVHLNRQQTQMSRTKSVLGLFMGLLCKPVPWSSLLQLL